MVGQMNTYMWNINIAQNEVLSNSLIQGKTNLLKKLSQTKPFIKTDDILLLFWISIGIVFFTNIITTFTSFFMVYYLFVY